MINNAGTGWGPPEDPSRSWRFNLVRAGVFIVVGLVFGAVAITLFILLVYGW